MKAMFGMITMSLVLSSMSFAQGSKEEMKSKMNEEKAAVKSACSAEASTAGCGDKEVGKGLLKCIHGYHKEHKKDFKISDGCKDAMKKMRHDRQEMKEMRSEMHKEMHDKKTENK